MSKAKDILVKKYQHQLANDDADKLLNFLNNGNNNNYECDNATGKAKFAF